MANIIVPQAVRPIKVRNPRGASSKQMLPPCCANEKNVVVLWLRHDLRLVTCQECGHKYYRLWAEPGSIGAMLRGR